MAKGHVKKSECFQYEKEMCIVSFLYVFVPNRLIFTFYRLCLDQLMGRNCTNLIVDRLGSPLNTQDNFAHIESVCNESLRIYSLCPNSLCSKYNFSAVVRIIF